MSGPVTKHDVEMKNGEHATRSRAFVENVPYFDGTQSEMCAGNFGVRGDASRLSYQGSAVK
jgi:hypothetical protein